MTCQFWLMSLIKIQEAEKIFKVSCAKKKKKNNNYQLRYDLAGKLMWSLIFLLFYLHVINTPFIILSKALPIPLMCLQLLGLFLLSFPKL